MSKKTLCIDVHPLTESPKAPFFYFYGVVSPLSNRLFNPEEFDPDAVAEGWCHNRAEMISEGVELKIDDEKKANKQNIPSLNKTNKQTMDKKYPKDTPVTLEILAEIMNQAHYPTINKIIDSMIEPPRPEPKEGEWWMCRYKNDAVETTAVLFHRDSHWYLTPTVITSWFSEFITPLYKMVPEKKAE